MKIAVIGAGQVGRARRQLGQPGLRHDLWRAQPGRSRHADLPGVMPVAAAVAAAEMLLLATPWHAASG
jgi:hypothetical protein